jgi:hypothetical protein
MDDNCHLLSCNSIKYYKFGRGIRLRVVEAPRSSLLNRIYTPLVWYFLKLLPPIISHISRVLVVCQHAYWRRIRSCPLKPQ